MMFEEVTYMSKKKKKDKIWDRDVAPAIRAQAQPKSEMPDLWPLVIKDMTERDRLGRAKYGTPLRSFNGRDPLVDAYQEALDLSVYLRQEIEERLHIDDIIRSLRRIPGLEDVKTNNLLVSIDYLVQRVTQVEQSNIALSSTVIHYQGNEHFRSGFDSGLETAVRIFESAQGDMLSDEEFEDLQHEAEKRIAETAGRSA